MLPQILGLLNFVLGRADRWRDRSVEQRTRVAAFLNAASDCLARIASDLRADRVPHSPCSELAHYARQLPETVERELGAEAADLLAALQAAAYSRTAALKRAEDMEYARKQMAVIEETAGKVKALAVSLSVG
jgi:hypothetical protein